MRPCQCACLVVLVLATFSGSSSAAEDALPGIVFVGAPIFDEKTDGGDGVYQGSYHWRDGYVYPRAATYHRAERTMGPMRPGRNLYALTPARPDGTLTRLTHLRSGAVFKPEPSYDGRKVLFAMRRDGEDWFHLYEINVDGTGLRQLTDGPFNDFAGVYLPDGRIVFCSDRTGYLEEYHEERTEALFVMRGDGTGIRQITFMPGTYFEPSVLRDGRILFSFWDAFHIDVPPFDKHETFLMTVNPDGTEERHLFGAGQYRFFNRERHSGVGLTQARELPDGRLLVQSEMGPSLLDLRAGLTVREALAPLFPGTTSVQVGGTTHRVHLSPRGTRSTAYPLPDGRILLSATLPGARDSAIYVCDPETREQGLVVNIPNHAEFDAVPVLAPRPRPALLPERPTQPGGLARFLVVAGRVADDPRRAEALRRARYFRVVEAEYTGVTTSSHTNLETRILGTVPILPDGSCYFEAPADTPLFLDPLDAAGNRVLMAWNSPNTSVALGLPYPATQMAYMVGRAGEIKGCYGCHATQTEAVPNAPLQAVQLGPVRVTRESTDIQYRRNEPEAYRRQARLDEAPRYQALLASRDPALRARGCEMLLHLEDGAGPALPRIVALLADEAVDVRRAAALALTRLATRREAEPLRRALRDDDWQVRFHAASALAALGAEESLRDEPLHARAAPPSLEHLGRLPPDADPAARAAARQAVRAHLQNETPDVLALRAAGKLRDPEAVPLLVPWLRRHAWEYHAAEAAVALGRIGTPEAVAALWDAVRTEVPIPRVHIARYLQHGPRPEEYALLKGLLLAGARPALADVPYLIALLPNTFMEKPRFEDRLRGESQRVLMPRLLLERAGLRQRAVQLLVAALRGHQETGDPLYPQLLRGINLERPFQEHGRPFPVVEQIGAEEALWLLACLLDPAADLPAVVQRQELEALCIPCLAADNHRERIDAAVLLGLVGFGAKAVAALEAALARPYPFPEIASIGKGMPDTNFRDKAYFAQALARHVEDVTRLRPWADPRTTTRDVRYGLTHGLALRGQPDGLPLLIDMATRDPITLIRQQARYAVADVQDALRLAGRPLPAVELPPEQPLEAFYPPRGLSWEDTSFPDCTRTCAPPPRDAAQLVRHLEACLRPGHFRSLSNAYATGAQRMMVQQVEETRQAVEALAVLPDDAATGALTGLLDTPYPYARYLALSALGQRGEQHAVPKLVGLLETCARQQDTVTFWAACDALGALQARDALPVLARHAVRQNPPGLHGPEGMALGYVAARALARIVADAGQPEVARLLASDNIWLRAGALRGLAEARAPGIAELLRQAAAEDSPAVVRTEARVQLRRLAP